MESLRPSVLVVGAGAIGGFYGGKLAQAGAHVSTVCRSDYDIVKDRGFEIKSRLGDFHFMPEKVIHDAGEYGGYADYVLVGLKVLPQVNMPELVRPAVGPQTAIVLIQNGVEIEGPVAGAFPGNEIISGMAFICVSRPAPGIIHHQDFGRLTIGNYPTGISERTKALGELFEAAGVTCQLTEDAVTARWQKLVWNAPFNPISVLGNGVDTRAMLESEESTKLIGEVMEEVCRISKAAGHPLPPSIVRRNIDDTRAMTPYKTSMLLDHEAKRPMEVEAIVGNAVRAARRENVSVPHLETLYALLQLVDRQNRL